MVPVSLKDERVLVLGASSGIGREAAKLFARDGAKVYASARRGERLAELATELAAEGFPIVHGVSDAGSHESMEALAADAVAKLRRRRCGLCDRDEYARPLDEAADAGDLE